MDGLWATKSECVGLIVRAITVISNLSDPDSQTSQRQTDGRTTCDRNTALCTIVHRAIKTAIVEKQPIVRRCLEYPAHADDHDHYSRCVNFHGFRLFVVWFKFRLFARRKVHGSGGGEFNAIRSALLG